VSIDLRGGGPPITLWIANFKDVELAVGKFQLIEAAFKSINVSVVWTPFKNSPDTIDPGLPCFGGLHDRW
jgi:hypothetical protein